MSEASTVKRALGFVRDSIAAADAKNDSRAEARSKKGHSYKPLPKQFRNGGFNYRQMAREGNVGIYEQGSFGSSNPSISYEVIRIRRREGFQIGSRFVEPAEVYPRPELWGGDGFTFTNRDKAWVKFSEISLEESAKTRKEVKNEKIVQEIRGQC